MTRLRLPAALAVPLLLGACGGRQEERAPDLPRLTLALSGLLQGRLDPCGCAANQKGGLAVRKTFLWQRRATGAVALEGGGFLPEAHWGEPFGRTVGRIALQCLGSGRDGMGYGALGVAAADLNLGLEGLLELAAATGAPPLVSGDLLDRQGRAALPRHAVIQAPGGAVFVTALSRRPLPPAAAALSRLPWRAALAAALAAAPVSSYRILFLDGDGHQAREAARAFPGRLDLILTSLYEYNPTPASLVERAGETAILDPGTGGKFLLEAVLERRAGRTELVAYIPHPLTPLDRKYGREPPPGAIPPDPALAERIAAERCGLATGEALAAAAAAGRPTPPPGGAYAGTPACLPCHEASAKAWAESPHARAWATLVKDEAERGWPITSSPDCVSCHVVGLGLRTGFRSPATTPELGDVGCESCHGPGAEHVRRMLIDPRDPRRAISRAGDGGLHCLACHDTERQTHGHFSYPEKWDQIRHAEPKGWADRVRGP